MMLRYLMFLLALPIGLSAQVGVNTETPKQALDVNGKLQIGDDKLEPTAGTVRYDKTQGDFQGYDGVAWRSFTVQQATEVSISPDKLITAYTSLIRPGESVSANFDLRMDNTQVTTPGPGVYFYITGINVIKNGFSFSADRYALSLMLSNAPDSGFGDVDNHFRLTGNLAEQNFITSETPLLVIGPGEYLRIEASSANEAIVNLQLRGYWVNSNDL